MKKHLQEREISTKLKRHQLPNGENDKDEQKKNTPIKMILTELNRDYKSIYNLTNLLGII